MARLSLVVEPKPLDQGRRVDSVEIVQLDIGRTPLREEYRLFPGNTATNRIEVTAADRARRQLVLVVDEPKRAFTATVPGTSRVVEMSTTGRLRHFLCGVDEAHLFIAQLPRPVANVVDAHEALAPEIPEQYDQRRMRRQGEWFFLPATAEERAELNVVSRREIRSGGLAEIARIRRHGRQHTATEARVLKPSRLYARGQIWHPDHAPLALRGWHRVLLNREPFEIISPRRVGIRWVD